MRVGRIKCLLRVMGLGKNERSRYVRKAWDADADAAPDDEEDDGVGGCSSAGMKMPWVASAACWRKTVESEDLLVEPSSDWRFCVGVGVGRVVSGSWRMSMGMDRRWQAKMAFMMGMYWCARSVEGEAEIRRIRDWRVLLLVVTASVVLVELLSAAAVPVVVDEAPIIDSAWRMDSRLIWLRARVRAPAIMVDVAEETESGVVVERRVVRLWRSSSSTRRKGRYLLPSSEVVVMVVVVDEGGGLRLSLRRLAGSC
jgi:hypothetical protein